MRLLLLSVIFFHIPRTLSAVATCLGYAELVRRAGRGILLLCCRLLSNLGLVTRRGQDGLMAADSDHNSVLLTKGPKQQECHVI